MNFPVKPINGYYKLFALLSFALAVLLAAALLRSKRGDEVSNEHLQDNEHLHKQLTNATATNKTQRKEYLYRLLKNTTRSLIQMEIKARRLEENIRRIKEKTADLLWKNKDKALWHILFKNISRHIAIRHEFHQHSSLKRIMLDTHAHKHRMGKRKVVLR